MHYTLIDRRLLWLGIAFALAMITHAAPASAQTAVESRYEEAWRLDEQGKFKAALKIWQELADQGDANAQYDLAMLYANGRIVPADHKAAMHWAERAAQQGHAAAQWLLGSYYADGLAGVRDAAAALRWLEAAAAQGQPNAYLDIADLYEKGAGVAKDFARARDWYRRALPTDDDGMAHHALCQLYLNGGPGLTQDYVTAWMWCELAVQRDFRSAARPRDWLAEQMTPAQREEANEMHKACQARQSTEAC